MQLPDETTNINGRRGHGEKSAFSLMRATATLIDSRHAEQVPTDVPALYWAGLLADISDDGAQVTMPHSRAKYFKRGLQVDIEIKTTLSNLNAEATAIIKSIKAGPDNNSVNIKVRFTNMDRNKKAQYVIARICELGKMLEGASAEEAKRILSGED